MLRKRWLLVIPVILLLMGCHSTATTAQKADRVKNGQFNGITLDVSRHHYQVSTLEKFITFVADHHGSFVQLHFTDDKDFAIENAVVGQTISRATKKNGIWRNNRTHQAFYSNQQIQQLLRLAKQRGVTLIPEIDTPAHVTGLVNTLKASGKAALAKKLSWHSNSYGDELHLNQASINFVKRIDHEVADDFAGQRNARFHLGGDEFTDKMTKNTAYIKYLNATSMNVEQLGFIPEAWNDGFLNTSLKAINHHIQVTYWNWTADQFGTLGKQRRKTWASMPRLIANHFKVLNYNDYYLYFNITKKGISKRDVAYMSNDMKRYWKPTLWDNDSATKLKSLHGIVGSSVSFWADSAGSITDKQIYRAGNKFIETFLRLAQKPLS
ncbi:family 20 glycosylhydrolase [Lentilactobacillus diolivorans]|nr:family 20 glycosylhydrolase [Lentilactobacillus diolivorans]GEP23215.1 lacto-N-biosidase [Lentilactobacillus diolivorans]